MTAGGKKLRWLAVAAGGCVWGCRPWGVRARSAWPAPAVREHGALGARPRTGGGGGTSAGACAAGARAFTPLRGGRGRRPGPGAPPTAAHVPEQGAPQPERPGASDRGHERRGGGRWQGAEGLSTSPMGGSHRCSHLRPAPATAVFYPPQSSAGRVGRFSCCWKATRQATPPSGHQPPRLSAAYAVCCLGAGNATYYDTWNDTEDNTENDTENNTENDTTEARCTKGLQGIYDTENDTDNDTENNTDNDTENDTLFITRIIIIIILLRVRARREKCPYLPPPDCRISASEPTPPTILAALALRARNIKRPAG